MPTGEATAALWRDPAFRRRRLAVLQAVRPWTHVDPAVLSERKKANWADPDYRTRQSAAIRRGHAQSYRRIVDLP